MAFESPRRSVWSVPGLRRTELPCRRERHEPEQVVGGPLRTACRRRDGIVIVCVAVVPFLSSPWLAFEQGRARPRLDRLFCG